MSLELGHWRAEVTKDQGSLTVSVVAAEPGSLKLGLCREIFSPEPYFSPEANSL
jgi:hypothetical protein